MYHHLKVYEYNFVPNVCKDSAQGINIDQHVSNLEHNMIGPLTLYFQRGLGTQEI